MDEETIKREASAALDVLELEARISAVTKAGDNWCIEFGGDYGQFCDEFKDLFGRFNSPRVVREKVKKHLLAQVTQLRNKGRRRAAKRDAGEDSAPGVAELLQETVAQTTRVVTDAIDRTVGLASAGLKSISDAAENLNSTGTPVTPPVREARSKPAPLPAKSKETRSASSRPGTAAKKRAASKPAEKTRTTTAGRTKKATKKAVGKKSSRKR